MSQIDVKSIEKSSYLMELVKLICSGTENPIEQDPRKSAVPYYVFPPSIESSGKVTAFPQQKAVYAIVRYFKHRGKLRVRVHASSST